MSGEVFEFDPVIYPTRLWVVISPEYDKVEEAFYFLDEDEEVVDDARREFNRHLNAVASTFPVAHKEDGWKGCLVAIWRRKECGAGICAHEASHVVDWLDEQFGIGGHSFMEGEARAYLIQWVANSIDKVLRGRV